MKGEIWAPKADEVKNLEPFGVIEDIVIAIAMKDRIKPLWQVGLAAGLGPGDTEDPDQQKVNLACAVSRRAKVKGTRRLQDHIQTLILRLEEYRLDGLPDDLPPIMPLSELLADDTRTIRKGSDTNGKCHDRIFAYHTKINPSDMSTADADTCLKQILESAGGDVDRAKAVCEVIAPNLVGRLETVARMNGDAR